MAVTIKPVERVWCRCPMKMERGVLIFSMLNCAISGIAGLVGVAGIFVHMLQITVRRFSGRENLNQQSFGLLVAGTLFLIFAFCFGIVLTKGVLEKKPHYVKIYFMYGVVANIIYLATSVLLHHLTSGESYHVYIVVACLGVCIIYTAILSLIWCTYKKLARENSSNQQYLTQNKLFALSRNSPQSVESQ